MSSKWKNKNFFEALKNSINGLIYAIKEQRNLKIQLFIAIIVLIFSIVLKISKMEMIVVCLSIFFVIFAEVTNTAIEKTVDLVTEEYNEKAKIAKDVVQGVSDSGKEIMEDIGLKDSIEEHMDAQKEAIEVANESVEIEQSMQTDVSIENTYDVENEISMEMN